MLFASRKEKAIVSRQESFASIKKTISRFDEITREGAPHESILCVIILH